MIYSETKERESRFKIALKIGFPFIVLIIFYILLTQINFFKDDDEIILLGILSLIYVYFIFYLIYFGFKSTLIDHVSKTFNRNYMFELIQKKMKKSPNSVLVMLKIENINDITNRYGVISGDNILQKFVARLDKFLRLKKYNDIPIGRYSGGYFLVLLDEKQSIVKQLFNLFTIELKNNEIKGIELKIDFVMTSLSYDKDIKNIIDHLIYKFEDGDIDDFIKPDIFDKSVCKSIRDSNFVFSSQKIIDLKSKEVKIYEIFIKLRVEGFGSYTNIQLRQIINKNGYERIFDEKMISSFLSFINSIEQDAKICLHISPYVLRNIKFKKFINEKVVSKQLDPQRFIFGFTEDVSYHDMKRFKEILMDYKNMGFEFLLNQFGGNNASLEYLKNLPINYVSFDLEFTKYIKKPRYNQILSSYIKLLKALNIISIVKFVENQSTYEKLEKLNVDMLQGYMIEKPKIMKEKI